MKSALWRNADFLKLWSGESVSQFGNQITLLALPLVGVLTLEATPFQLGVLNALSYLPFLVLTLFVGVWVDRVRRRPVLVVSSLGRGLVLLTVPLLHASGHLTIGYLFIVAVLLGVLTVFFEVTYQAYLPSVVAAEDLVDGNSKLQISVSTAQVGGPAIGGWLVTLLTAPIALLVDAATFLASVVGLASIRTKEERPQRDATERPPIMRDIASGLRFTFRNRWLRPCVLEAGTYNLFWLVLETAFLIYAVRELGLTAGEIGTILGTGAAGALVGALLPKWLSARIGVGSTVSLAMVVGCVAPVLVPLASGPKPVVFTVLVVSFVLGGMGTTVANIQVVSLRQIITPKDMLGRMNASYRFISWGVVPLGALVGGALGETIGLRPTLYVGAIGIFAAALWIVFSPIRTLREMPESPDTSEQEPAAVTG